MILLSPAASLRFVVESVGRLLVIVLAASFPGMISTAAAGPFVATNVPGEMLITVDDYLSELPLDMLSEEQRAELLASGTVILTDSTSSGWEYFAGYQFLAVPEIQVRSSLIVTPSADEATQLVADFLRSMTQRAQSKGVELRPIDGLDAWYPGSRYFELSRTEAPHIGNAFIVIKDNSVYTVIVEGAGAYVDAASVRQFLGPKLELAMTLRPDIPAALRAAVEKPGATSTEKKDRDPSTAPVFLLFFIIVYWAGRWLAHAINWLCKRPLVSPTLSGLLSMVVVAVGLGWVMMGAIAQHVGNLRKIDPYQAGLLEGEVVGTFLGPVLIITVVIGVRRMMALKPTRQSITKDVTSGPR